MARTYNFKKLDEKGVDIIINDYINGMSANNIAKKWKTKERFIREILDSHKKAGDERLVNFKSSNPAKIVGFLRDNFLKKYMGTNKTTKDISDEEFLLCRSVQGLILRLELPLRNCDKEHIRYLYEKKLIRGYEIALQSYLPYSYVKAFIKEEYKEDFKKPKGDKPINPYFLKRGKITTGAIFNNS